MKTVSIFRFIVPLLFGFIFSPQDARAGGPVASWGRGAIFCGYCDSVQTRVPGDLTNAVAVARRRNHILATRSGGTGSAWGAAFIGASAIPAGLSYVVALPAH